eukprot:PhF_6_TR34159/c0_g1_i8/m.49929
MVPACVCGTPRNFEHIRCWYCAKEHVHDPEAPTVEQDQMLRHMGIRDKVRKDLAGMASLEESKKVQVALEQQRSKFELDIERQRMQHENYLSDLRNQQLEARIKLLEEKGMQPLIINNVQKHTEVSPPHPAPCEANPSNSSTMRKKNKTYAERNKRCREDNAKLVKENEALKLQLMIATYEKELSVKDAKIATLQKELAMQKNARQQIITINNYNCAKCRPSVDF